ncbi:uncharacterized protein LOC142339906 [Convolutriloba macropyga]|uniref:uncharacterized protein LOC142339906 n=1 Tax=Convolutriloba macropyga TaxID=536237 RepID=UPI003F51D3BE
MPPKKKGSNCEQIGKPEKGFLIAAIVLYIIIFFMSVVGHLPHCGSNGGQYGGLWKVCNTLGCIGISSQEIIDEQIFGIAPEDYAVYQGNSSAHLTRVPSDFMLLNVARLGLLGSHLLSFGVILSLGLRIALIFSQLAALVMSITLACCHYIFIMMAAMVTHIAIYGIFDKTDWVVYVIIAAFLLTNVAIFVAFGHLIGEHLKKNKVVKKDK